MYIALVVIEKHVYSTGGYRKASYPLYKHPYGRYRKASYPLYKHPYGRYRKALTL
jgi:hypothetical protein